MKMGQIFHNCYINDDGKQRDSKVPTENDK